MNLKPDYLKILESFADVSVLVVGDIMLDRYWWGSVERISPEAPVPVVHINKTSLAVGGAANVAANIVGLGAKVHLVAAVGEDAEGAQLPQLLSESGLSAEHLIKISGRPTTLKTRVIAHNQHVVRIDHETTENLNSEDEKRVWERVEKIIREIDVVILSDYAKGFLSEKLIMRLITTAKNNAKILMVDPKGKDYLKYKGASIITPNKKEAAEASGLEEKDSRIIEKAGDQLLNELDLKSLLITQGEDGMTLFETGKLPKHFSSQARHVYDVTGAGDTVIATLAVAAGTKIDLATAAEIANTAAGYVVEEVGTTVINRKQLEDHYKAPDTKNSK
jgi:rfaE bifunctional protein kinase chain/domain